MKFSDEQQACDFYEASKRLEVTAQRLRADRTTQEAARLIAEAANALQALVLIHRDVVQHACDHGGMRPDATGCSAASCRTCGVALEMPKR